MAYAGSDILNVTAPGAGVSDTTYSLPQGYTQDGDGNLYRIVPDGEGGFATTPVYDNPPQMVATGGSQFFDPYSTKQADYTAQGGAYPMGINAYWGKRGSAGDPTEQLKSTVWGAYNQLIQAQPELAGKILNPDALAIMAFSSRMQADPSQTWTNAVPGPEWNIPQTAMEMINALYNQAPVLKALGQTQIDVTTSPQAQQAIQSGNAQAIANQNYATNYGSGTFFGPQGAIKDVAPVIGAALAFTGVGLPALLAGGDVGAAIVAGAADLGIPSGIAATLPAAVGAAGQNLAAQLLTKGTVDPGTVATAALVGGAVNGMTTEGLPPAVASSVGNLVTQVVKTGTIDPTSLGLAAATAGLAAAVGDTTGLSPTASNQIANMVASTAMGNGVNPVAAINAIASTTNSIVNGPQGSVTTSTDTSTPATVPPVDSPMVDFPIAPPDATPAAPAQPSAPADTSATPTDTTPPAAEPPLTVADLAPSPPADTTQATPTTPPATPVDTTPAGTPSVDSPSVDFPITLPDTTSPLTLADLAPSPPADVTPATSPAEPAQPPAAPAEPTQPAAPAEPAQTPETPPAQPTEPTQIPSEGAPIDQGTPVQEPSDTKSLGSLTNSDGSQVAVSVNENDGSVTYTNQDGSSTTVPSATDPIQVPSEGAPADQLDQVPSEGAPLTEPTDTAAASAPAEPKAPSLPQLPSAPSTPTTPSAAPVTAPVTTPATQTSPNLLKLASTALLGSILPSLVKGQTMPNQPSAPGIMPAPTPLTLNWNPQQAAGQQQLGVMYGQQYVQPTYAAEGGLMSITPAQMGPQPTVGPGQMVQGYQPQPAPQGIAPAAYGQTGAMPQQYVFPLQGAQSQQAYHVPSMAAGGEVSHLGGYSDGGRLLRGPGDGMSDNIPATIGHKQPARLADGEFVIPADVVSHLGNGSTEAGAKVLYKMMERVRKARTGNPDQGHQINAHKFMPR